MEPYESGAGVPPRALLISLLALVVPVAGTVFFPQHADDEVGLLFWLPALVPAFLLTYYRGWWGVSVALAIGMAALSLAQAALVTFDLATPEWGYLLVGVAVYLGICLGAGTMAGRLHSAAELALTDELTGLPNRRHASLFLESTFAAAERGHPMTVVLFDLDDFKSYNDRNGHVAGDAVLERFGEILGSYTRKMNISARYGGEEFISILANSRLEGAEIFVSRILDALRNTEFPGGTVTASAGLAEYEPGMGTPEVLVAAADRVLYECKENGGDGYRMAPRTLGEKDPLMEEHLEEQARRRRASWDRTEDGVGEPSGARGSSGSRVLKNGPARRAADPGSLPGGDETILLVESDPDARRAMTALLERLGYRVVETSGGEEALGRLDSMEEFPDLLVTDLGMDDMSGFTLAEQVESRVGELRVVYISGHAHGEVLWRGAPGTSRSFVHKPFDVAELAEKVRGTLEGRGASASESR